MATVAGGGAAASTPLSGSSVAGGGAASGPGGGSSSGSSPVPPQTPPTAGGGGGGAASSSTMFSPAPPSSSSALAASSTPFGGGPGGSGFPPGAAPSAAGMGDSHSRARAGFRPSVLTSDVHNEAEIIFHILEHREKECVSKLDMLTLLRGMGMNPTDGDLDALHTSMAPLIEEYEEMVREEEKRKERERKKMEAQRGGPKSTNVVKDRAEKERRKLEAFKNKGKDSGRGGSSRPSTAATGDTADDGKTEEEKKKEKAKLEPPEEVKNIDWHIFMHCVEPVFKDARQEENELMEAFAVFDPDNTGKMTMEQLVEIATQNGASVLNPAEVKQLRDAFPEQAFNFRDFTKKLLGTYVPPPPPTAEELQRIAREKAEALRRAKEEQLGSIDGLLAASAGQSPGASTNAAGDASPAATAAETEGGDAGAPP